MNQYTPADITLVSFNCPHCGAFAHHRWYNVAARETSQNANPVVSFTSEQMLEVEQHKSLSQESKLARVESMIAITAGDIFRSDREDSYYSSLVYNLNLSECHACNKLTVWHHDKILYPDTDAEIECNSDASAEVRADFEEARIILSKSPRGAAALLRLAVQKLCLQLGERGRNINEDIASLVQKGLPIQIQRALDIVRVIGNDAVHPGQIDLRDNTETARALFDLVNLIVEDRISRPEHIEHLYASLPEDKRKAIERRDQPKP